MFSSCVTGRQAYIWGERAKMH